MYREHGQTGKIKIRVGGTDRETTNGKIKQGTQAKQETKNPYGINKGIMYR